MSLWTWNFLLCVCVCAEYICIYICITFSKNEATIDNWGRVGFWFRIFPRAVHGFRYSISVAVLFEGWQAPSPNSCPCICSHSCCSKSAGFSSLTMLLVHIIWSTWFFPVESFYVLWDVSQHPQSLPCRCWLRTFHVTTKNASRHCQISLGLGIICRLASGWEPLVGTNSFLPFALLSL